MYYVQVITDMGKSCAFAERWHGENLATLGYKVTIIHPCKTKKEAETLADAWNDSYKANGDYLENIYEYSYKRIAGEEDIRKQQERGYKITMLERTLETINRANRLGLFEVATNENDHHIEGMLKGIESVAEGIITELLNLASREEFELITAK